MTNQQSNVKIPSKFSKSGYYDIHVPEEYLKYNGTITVKIPKKDLIGDWKTGQKIGTFQIQKKPNGKLGNTPILKTMFSTYITIKLIVE